MFKRLQPKQLLLALAILGYLVVTLPAVFDADHQLLNLEPYPDGLLYALSGRNLALGRGLQLVSNTGHVDFWVPPLYAVILGVGYIFSDQLLTFYVLNVGLGVVTWLVLYQVLKKVTTSWLGMLAGLLVFASHLIIFWLPSVPMTENISLLLCSVLVWGLLEEKIRPKLVLLGLSMGGLLLVRFALLPIVLTAGLIGLFQLRHWWLPYRRWAASLASLGVIGGLLLLGTPWLQPITATFWGALTNSEFFNLSYIMPNLVWYGRALLFQQGLWLWLSLGITSWPLLGLFGWSIYEMHRQRQWRILGIISLLFVSLWPLQLLFYSADARYLLYTVIFLAVAIGWLLDHAPRPKLLFALTLLAALLNIWWQRDLARTLIANNLLGRSTAWQYQAVDHFNQVLGDEDYLITALPPFLVDAYQTRDYRVLPLSPEQEFLQKEILAWGDDVPYDNLLAGYQTMLEQGQELYITNAYITHQVSVIEDYEMFTHSFELELVSSGCLESCNLYRLRLPGQSDE